MDPAKLLLVVAMLGGLMWGTLWYLRHMARQALNPRFSWQPLDPARGESIDISVDVEAAQVVVVRGVEAHLIATRYAYPAPDTQGGGALFLLDGDRPMGTPEKDIFSHSRVALCHDMTFKRGEPMKLVAQLDVPSDALPTHVSGRLQIHWTLRIRFDIANFPAPLVLDRSIEIRREPANRKPNYRAQESVAAPVLLEEPAYTHRSPMAAAPVKPPQSGLEIDGPKKPLPPKHDSAPPAGRWPWSTDPDKSPSPPDMLQDPHGAIFQHLEIDVDRADPPKS